MTKQQAQDAKKVAVIATATSLMKANNSVTTLEIKTAVMASHDEFYWDQQVVSDIMDGCYQNLGLNYTVVSSPGGPTYRKYSYANQPVNQPVVGKRPVGRPRKVVSAPPVAAAPAKRPVGRPRKTVAITAPVTAPITTPVVATRGPGRPRKTPAVVVAPTKATPISRSKAVELIEAAGGTYFTATFIKKGGAERTMNCQYLKNQGAQKLGYVKVRIPGKLKAGEAAIRNVNMQTLKALKIKGTTYKVR